MSPNLASGFADSVSMRFDSKNLMKADLHGRLIAFALLCFCFALRVLSRCLCLCFLLFDCVGVDFKYLIEVSIGFLVLDCESFFDAVDCYFHAFLVF